jgi:molecular chaperone DnaK
MCGGRDIDRALTEQIVVPWLQEQFDLPEEVLSHPEFVRLRAIGNWASERAKIELSSKSASVISIQESELRLKDKSGTDMYLEVPIERTDLERVLASQIEATIASTRDVLVAAHLSSDDVERIVFIGGPTQYKPLRDAVCAALKLPGDTRTDPMTAVAEGAALFSESVDWTSESRGRKGAKGASRASASLGLAFEYIARTKPRTVPQSDTLDLQLERRAGLSIRRRDSGRNGHR